MIKRTKRVKLWVGLAIQMQVVHGLCANVYVWKERNRRRVASMFMSMRIKIAFRRRFYRQFGMDFDIRQTKYIQRSFTLTGALCSSNKAFHHRAKDMIFFVLYRTFFIEESTRLFKEFLAKAANLKNMIKERKQISVLRRVLQLTKFDKELKYVIWAYQKLQYEALQKMKKKKGNKSPGYIGAGSKSYKEYIQKLKKLRDGIEFETMDDGGISNKNYLIDQACRRMSELYLLDFQIWLFLKNNDSLSKLHLLQVSILEKNAMRADLLERQSRCISRMKGFVNRIYQYEEILFSDTGNVEQDNLFVIDPEYDEKKGEDFGAPASPEAKSSPSKLTKQSNNNSPSPTKSMQSRKAKSPGKVLKPTTAATCTPQPESATFAKFEQQSRLVTLLIENHLREYEGISPTNRCGETPETEAALTEPYLQLGFLAFPPYILTISREDMQRLVCRCAGLGQDEEFQEIKKNFLDAPPKQQQNEMTSENEGSF